MKICVVIPAYNEAAHVGGLISSIRARRLDVLVVDDGSTDGTAASAQAAGATVMRNQTNRGKGAALAAGFSCALRKGYDAVITVDGDGQHHPEDLDQFIALAAQNYGIVVGNRLHNPRSMPITRLLTNRFMSWIISSVTGQRIPDTQCGFRLIKRAVLEAVSVETSKYEIESEILIKGSRLGFKIASVPVKSIYQNEQSYINPVTDTFRFVRYLARELFARGSKRGR
jgi:glycosyltransferase involved in cell wall biosynthesis